MYTVHGKGADLAFFPRFNIGTDKSTAKSGATLQHMHLRSSTIFTVFGMTRPRVG